MQKKVKVYFPKTKTTYQPDKITIDNCGDDNEDNNILCEFFEKGVLMWNFRTTIENIRLLKEECITARAGSKSVKCV